MSFGDSKMLINLIFTTNANHLLVADYAAILQ